VLAREHPAEPVRYPRAEESGMFTVSESIAGSGSMKRIFLGYSNRDKVLARLLYHYLSGYIWPDATIFAYELSLTPGKSWADQATDEASSSDLGVFVLSEYIKNVRLSPSGSGHSPGQESLRHLCRPSRRVARRTWIRRPHQSFPMFNYKNPMETLPDLGALLRSHLSLPAESEAKREKRRFEDQHMRGNESERDAYVLVDAIKCGEKKILILGENALHPIHGASSTSDGFSRPMARFAFCCWTSTLQCTASERT
jgi:hypothetical protein